MVKPKKLKEGWNRDRIMTEISLTGLNCGVDACGELYEEIAFNKYNAAKSEGLAKALKLINITLMFQVCLTLTSHKLYDTIASVMEKLFSAVILHLLL